MLVFRSSRGYVRASASAPSLGHASRSGYARVRVEHNAVQRVLLTRGPRCSGNNPARTAGPAWVKEVGRTGEAATAPLPHPCFPGSCLPARAPPHLLQPNWPGLSDPVGTGSGAHSTALSGARIFAGVPRPRVSHLFALVPRGHLARVSPLRKSRQPAEESERRVTSGGLAPLGPSFSTCLNPGDPGSLGPGLREGQCGLQHPNTTENRRKNEERRQGPGKHATSLGDLAGNQVAPGSLLGSWPPSSESPSLRGGVWVQPGCLACSILCF